MRLVGEEDLFWSGGVLECWSVGKPPNSWCLPDTITPLLHYSNTPWSLSCQEICIGNTDFSRGSDVLDIWLEGKKIVSSEPHYCSQGSSGGSEVTPEVVQKEEVCWSPQQTPQ